MALAGVDLQVPQGGRNYINVSIDTDTLGESKDASHFVSISKGGSYAAFHMSVPKLRRFAKAILEELDR